MTTLFLQLKPISVSFAFLQIPAFYGCVCCTTTVLST